MGNEVAARQGTNSLSFAVPAHLAQAMVTAGGGNIAEKQTVPSLTYGGKVWTMSVGGEKKVLQRRNEDGEMENVQVLRVVVLDYSKHRGRSYYEGAFNPDDPKQPDCWSEDGKRPHASVEQPACGSCELCPKAAKGSRIVDGREMIACAQYRMVVVVPASNLDFQPLRLRLAVTSDWDKGDDEAVAAGWYGFQNYTDFLRANGCGYTNALVTRMRFANTNFPKVQFARGDFLALDDFNKTLAVAQTDEVKKLLAGFTPAGAEGKPTEHKGKALPVDDDEAPTGPAPTGPDPVFSKTGAAAEKAQAEEHAKAAEEAARKASEAEEVRRDHAAAAKVAADAAAKAAKKAAKVAAAKAAAEAAAAAALAAEEDEDEDGSAFDEAPTAPVTPPAAIAPKATAVADAPPPKKAAKKEPALAPATAPAEVPPSLGGILGEWE